MTYQVRVTDIIAGHKWYQTFLQKAPDFMPHEGFVEWEVVPGCWLQVAEGKPSSGSGPLRFAVKDLAAEKARLVSELKIEDFEVFSREEVPVKWGTFSDPWGNRIGLFEYIDKLEESLRVETILGKIEV